MRSFDNEELAGFVSGLAHNPACKLCMQCLVVDDVDDLIDEKLSNLYWCGLKNNFVFVSESELKRAI